MNTPHHQRGFTLLEALVSVAVLSLGMLSVAKLHSDLMASSGLSKARTEAVQLAESELEQLRNMMLESQFNAITDVTGGAAVTVTGTNATFTLQREVTDATAPTRKNIAVTVSWNDPKEGTQTVRVSGLLAWNDPALGLLAGGGGLGGNIGRITPPTGAATQGGREYTNLPTGAVTNTLPDGTTSDGTYTYDAADGKRELLVWDADKNKYVAVLTVAPNKGFSTISGRVYSTSLPSKKDPTGYPFFSGKPTAQTTYVMSSDASYCANVFASPLITVGSQYIGFQYKCYFGAGWYGNIGIVRTDAVSPSERVCVGRPNEPVDATRMDSEHPALSTVRMYRGFKLLGDGHTQSTGIGIDPSTGNYTPTAYTGHDFLLTVISGNPVDSSCNARLQLVDATTPFGNNVGRGFCFTSDCPPDPLSTIVSATTTISGTVTGGVADVTYVTDITVAGGVGTCEFDADSYSCVIDWKGWTGTTWTGDMSFTVAGGSVCAEAGPGSLTDNKITFTGVTSDTTAITEDVTLCPSTP